LFGETSSSVKIRDNGRLDFPEVRVRPFNADVDATNGGDIYYRKINNNSFAVAWVNVERFGGGDGKTNTFQVLITDGSIGGRSKFLQLLQ
jgi:hypothetical protein